MSPSETPSKIRHLPTILIGLGLILVIMGTGPEFISSVNSTKKTIVQEEPAKQEEPWMIRAIRNVKKVQVDQLYASPALLATNKLSEEIQQILFKKEDEPPEIKHVEHDSVRGIYVTAETAASKNFMDLIDTLIASGGNAVVMDIEKSGGQLAFVPEDEYLTSINPGSTKLGNLKSLIKTLHEKDIYVIARQVVFNDPYAGAKKPEWCTKYKSGRIFDCRWLDPSHPEVQNYNLIITREAAKLGFDEIQYDYIRFPAKNHALLDYAYDETTKERWEVINDFLKEAKKVTDEYGIKLGVDVFGATIWGDVDWDNVGQYIPELAKTVDVIYPMTYPSHVSPGYNGFKNPYGDPYSFVQASIKKFVEASAGNAEIRTWVQGFPLRIPNYGSWFVQKQVQATYDGGANDFVVWSPGNVYGTSWSSMGLLPPEPLE